MIIIELVAYLVVPLVLLVLGLTVGRLIEKLHFARLDRAEFELQEMLTSTVRTFPGGGDPGLAPAIVAANVVISADYFMSFVAMLKKIIGGRIKPYERVIERARREATVRILREAESMGFDAVCNIRLETTDLLSSRGKKKNGVAMSSVYAYGTAYKRAGR